MCRKNIFWLFILFLTPLFLNGQDKPPSVEKSAENPIVYTGDQTSDKRYYDGAIPHAVGVHNYQAFRANRKHPLVDGVVGWTYSHQPNLAYWNGKFYLHYLSNLTEEHGPPGRTLMLTSTDGLNWTRPTVIFPKYQLPEIRPEDIPEKGIPDYLISDFDDVRNKISELGGRLPEGTYAVMHQRMGFYVAPNNRLLTLGFYSYCPSPRVGPNNGHGIGRVVREVYKDGTLGPIYFIRYNKHAGWSESNTRYPLYTNSEDNEFIEACEALLNDRLMTLQWWEEEQSQDGFYSIQNWADDFGAKAFSWLTRPDGVILGAWKSGEALSSDGGKSWTRPVPNDDLYEGDAKVWIQKTDDNRFALVYCHSTPGTDNRFPLVVMTSNDAHKFDDVLTIQGEVPQIRFHGFAKNQGPQYIRGIVPGNGNPPGKHMWNTYSMNKEDIWVSRTHVPVIGEVNQHVSQNFDELNSIGDLELWNLHVPLWAPVSLAADPVEPDNQCLQLKDEEPYDYAHVERIIPETERLQVSFNLYAMAGGPGELNFEAQGRTGKRPLKLRFDHEWISMDRGTTEPDLVPFRMREWTKVTLRIDCKAKEYDLAVNGKWVEEGIEFDEEAEDVSKLGRLVFRTGSWKGDVRAMMMDGNPSAPGMHIDDVPGADERVTTSIYYIDDVVTEEW